MKTVDRSDHSVSRSQIGDSALKVLYRLKEGGYQALLVGGGVRDILTGLTPKDFDIATDAEPEEIRELFQRNSRIIGRRFRLVHVRFGREVIEVATFRAAHGTGVGGETGESGRILRDNVFGTIEEDAQRRDFTVNALYYNIRDFSILDYVGGLDDIKSKTFRLIGDPVTRCEEDPVRIIRAARLAAKLDFDIDAVTLDAMARCAPLIADVPPARLYEEVLKLFQGGYAEKSFEQLRKRDLLRYLLPLTADAIERQPEPLLTMLGSALANTDARVQQGKPITPAYLLAFMLWPDIHTRSVELYEEGSPAVDSLLRSSEEVLPQQLRITSIPRRYSVQMKEIWTMQPRLEQYTGTRALSLMQSRRFRAAYDFLCLRASVDERLTMAAEWWTEVQEIDDDDTRLEFASQKVPSNADWPQRSGQNSGSKKKRRRRRKKKSNP